MRNRGCDAHQDYAQRQSCFHDRPPFRVSDIQCSNPQTLLGWPAMNPRSNCAATMMDRNAWTASTERLGRDIILKLTWNMCEARAFVGPIEGHGRTFC